MFSTVSLATFGYLVAFFLECTIPPTCTEHHNLIDTFWYFDEIRRPLFVSPVSESRDFFCEQGDKIEFYLGAYLGNCDRHACTTHAQRKRTGRAHGLRRIY